MRNKDILQKLPYGDPFLFVDEILSVSSEAIAGTYTFKKDAVFYEGHFKDNPVTPGVLITECMAQIGLVCLGIYLLDSNTQNTNFALSHTDIDFFQPVFPGEEIKVVSEKIYFRFGKLKCKVKMVNAEDKLIAKGTISGMIINTI